MLYLRNCERSIGDASIGVAAALGLLCLVLELGLVPAVVVTGSLDLNGRVGEVFGLVGKLQV
jgi:predicted S18 family serine protease